MITLRPKQQEIMAYSRGRMGISAVPGSGKTWTLSLLAAELIKRGVLKDEQEILIVTLVNSAVDNFYQRISSFIQEFGLFPNIGYRVRTLHGLAHDIVRERPDLLGLDTNFQIVDEREADSIREDVAQAWLNANLFVLDAYLDPELEDSRRDHIIRADLPGQVSDIAVAFIRYAKDQQLTPDQLHQRLASLPVPLPLAQMGYEIYANYQRSLAYRGAVDFDDLIRLAMHALQWDPVLLEKLRQRWPYILEDEAQDSSLLQEKILRQLVGADGNWVRVGDPNQAIYETFTTANPIYLQNFLAEPGAIRRELPNSGRSTRGIIDLANYLVQWSSLEHPNPEAQSALLTDPLIEPAPQDDPQPNPDDRLTRIHLPRKKYSADDEVIAVADSIQRWLPDHPEETLAVLAPRNTRAFALVDVLRTRNIPYSDDLLRSSSSTRFSAGALGNVLRYLADPQSANKLSTVYRVWRRAERTDEAARAQIEHCAELIKKLKRVEDYLWPTPDTDWLEDEIQPNQDPDSVSNLDNFRKLVQRWQQAIFIPIDQLVLTIGQDILTQPAELALSHKLAILLRNVYQDHPGWRLPELAAELAVIARNERRFLGFNDSDTGFDPDKFKGKVMVSTIHKAKGLEWDRVYLMSVNSYDFPTGIGDERYFSEKWYIRDHLNLEAEALAQLKAALSTDEYQWYNEGQATLQARQDYIRERLRLLYVGITRARKELVITWNTGRRNNQQPALALVALQAYLESHLGSEV